MQLWQDGVIAALASVGLASLLWTAVRWALFAPPRESRWAAALVMAQGDGAPLEQQIRTLQRLRREQGVIGRILVIDCGLSREGRKLADILTRQNRWITVCSAEDVEHYLTGTVPVTTGTQTKENGPYERALHH